MNWGDVFIQSMFMFKFVLPSWTAAICKSKDCFVENLTLQVLHHNILFLMNWEMCLMFIQSTFASITNATFEWFSTFMNICNMWILEFFVANLTAQALHLNSFGLLISISIHRIMHVPKEIIRPVSNSVKMSLRWLRNMVRTQSLIGWSSPINHQSMFTLVRLFILR